MVHTGLNGDTTDGRLKDFVLATTSTFFDATGAVLGGLRQSKLSAKDGGRVKPNQCESARDGFSKLAGSVASFFKWVRFTFPQQSDGGLLVEYDTEQLSSGKRKLCAAIATHVEAERELEPAPTSIKQAYNTKAKANIIEGKAAADGTIECSKFAKQMISSIKGKFTKKNANRVNTDTIFAGGECSTPDK